ncbi:MAG TPA: substrate-binding domain-containing protein [Anaerolineae bacterium]|nr:substrate-binding domain-containing protein [Anaerolineae bacterium]
MKRLILLLGVLCLALMAMSCAPVTPAAQPTSALAQPTAAPAQPTAAAQPTTAAAKTPKYHRFGFLVLQSGTKRYFGADVPNFTQVAKDAGYEVIAQSAENDAKTQVSQAENLLTQGIDVLVLQPVNNETAAGIVTEANEAGVPVISYNDLVSNAPIVAFVGRDPEVGGRVSAEAALKVHPTGNYVLISGDPGQTVATGFMKGYKAGLDEAVKAGKVKIVAEQFDPEWKTETAVSIIENALTQNKNDIQAVLVAYDAMAFGVMDALKAQGLEPGIGPNQVFVTGQDVLEGGAQAIAEGRMGGSAWGEFGEMGKRAAETAIAVAEGRDFKYDSMIDNGSGKPIPWVQAPIYLVTKDNLAEWACKNPWWLTIDTIYKNIPKDQWPKCP